MFAVVSNDLLCAVRAGAHSCVMIVEWARGRPVSVRLPLGIGQRGAPSESTIRRILQRVNPDAREVAVSGWLARRVTGPTSIGGARRAFALDGKTVRGARIESGRAAR